MRYVLILMMVFFSCHSPKTSAPAVIERSHASQPAWVSQVPKALGQMCFMGLSSGCMDKAKALDAALNNARKEAASYMGVLVKGKFKQLIREEVRDGMESYGHQVESETKTTVNALIEKAEQAEAPYWIRYEDLTYDCRVLIRVKKENLDPVKALTRALRRAAARSNNPRDRVRLMDNLLILSLHDSHALYVKARAHGELGEKAKARAAYETLISWNKSPILDLRKLYLKAGLPFPEGAPEKENLEEVLFGLKPHWEELIARLIQQGELRANPSMFRLKTNRSVYHKSQYDEQATPILMTLVCPDGKTRWASVFWISKEGICQVNGAAPLPDKTNEPKRWAYPIDGPEGEVILLALASKDKNMVSFQDADLSFERIIRRDQVEKQRNREEILRLESFVDMVEKRAFVSAITRFAIQP